MATKDLAAAIKAAVSTTFTPRIDLIPGDEAMGTVDMVDGGYLVLIGLTGSQYLFENQLVRAGLKNLLNDLRAASAMVAADPKVLDKEGRLRVTGNLFFHVPCDAEFKNEDGLVFQRISFLETAVGQKWLEDKEQEKKQRNNGASNAMAAALNLPGLDTTGGVS